MANEVTMLHNLRGNILAYAGGKFYRLSQTQEFVLHDIVDTTYVRPYAESWLDHLIVTGPNFTPKVFDRSTLVADCADGPKALISCLFKDHLICGNIVDYKGNKYPNRIMGSGLRHFNQWEEKVENEATHYDLDSYDSAFTLVGGVTGLKVFNGSLLAYTPRQIHIIDYIGLPNVYNKTLFIGEVGCVLPHSLIGNNRMHFFVSEDNIFMLHADEGLQPIGEPVFEYVQDTITQDKKLLTRTWAFYDGTNGEVVWQYYSRQGVMNKQIGFDVFNRRWRVDSCEPLFSFAVGKLTNSITRIVDIQGTIKEQTNTIAEYTDEDNAIGTRLFGSDELQIITDATNDEFANFIARSKPYLETRDFYFGDLAIVKELRGVKLNADYDNGNCDGIDVYFSGRNHFDEVVEYTYLGKWTKGIKFDKLSGFNTVSGIIWRLKFVPSPIDTTKPVAGVSVTTISFETNYTKTTITNDGKND